MRIPCCKEPLQCLWMTPHPAMMCPLICLRLLLLMTQNWHLVSAACYIFYFVYAWFAMPFNNLKWRWNQIIIIIIMGFIVGGSLPLPRWVGFVGCVLNCHFFLRLLLLFPIDAWLNKCQSYNCRMGIICSVSIHSVACDLLINCRL